MKTNFSDFINEEVKQLSCPNCGKSYDKVVDLDNGKCRACGNHVPGTGTIPKPKSRHLHIDQIDAKEDNCKFCGAPYNGKDLKCQYCGSVFVFDKGLNVFKMKADEIKGIKISTILITGYRYETAAFYKNMNDVLETYDTEKDAIAGHKKYLREIEKNPKEFIKKYLDIDIFKKPNVIRKFLNF